MWEQIGGRVGWETLKWIWRRSSRGKIRVETRLERGPSTRELGFTESAIKISVVNESVAAITIVDIRLMFSGGYGASVAPLPPPERSHPKLPASIKSGTEGDWYIPAEKLSALLYDLYHPPSTTKPIMRKVKLYARCITGSGKVYKSPAFSFPTDPGSFGF